MPIPYNRLKQLVDEIHDTEVKAFVATQYGTGARIGELIRYTHRYTNGKIHHTAGLLKSKIDEEEKYYSFWIPNFKNANRDQKRAVIVKSEKWLIEPILAHLEYCGEQVFRWKEARARQLVREAIGFSSHYLRHSRAQHLVDLFNFNSYELMDTMGHANLNTSVAYVLASPRERAKKIEDVLGR